MSGALDARLGGIFPGDPPSEPHPWLASELQPDERVVWQGRPNRWGFLTATLFVVALVAALGLLWFTLGGPEAGVGGAFDRLLTPFSRLSIKPRSSSPSPGSHRS